MSNPMDGSPASTPPAQGAPRAAPGVYPFVPNPARQPRGLMSPQISPLAGVETGLRSNVLASGFRLPGISEEVTDEPELLSRHSPDGLGDDSVPFIIGVCGGTASGKSTVCDMMRDRLQGKSVVFIPSDMFYKTLTPEQIDAAHRSEYDFDVPDAIDWELLCDVVEKLRRRQSAILPKYDFVTHSRVDAPAHEQWLKASDVIIVEGILVFAASQRLRDLMDLKVFVDADSDLRLARRVERDLRDRGRSVEGVLDQYMRFVRPSQNNFVEPSKRYADVVIPNIGDAGINQKAVDLLMSRVNHELNLAKTRSSTTFGNFRQSRFAMPARSPRTDDEV